MVALISVGVGCLAHGYRGVPGLQLVVPLLHGPFIYISKVVACYAGLDCKSQMVATICRTQQLNSGEAKWLEMKRWELEGHHYWMEVYGHMHVIC